MNTLPRETGTDLDERATLLDLVDCALNKGIVLRGHLTISVADVDLVYIGLWALISSAETARRHGFLPDHMDMETSSI